MKTRKELKEEYKQKKFQMGVFQIRNKSNGKVFIGSSLDLMAKWNSQKFQLNAGMHPNIELQKDWDDYGEDNFEYEIIEELKQEEGKVRDYRREIKTLETTILEEHQPYEDKGYNKRK